MISIKTEKEIEIMRKGGKILSEVLFEVVSYIKPGISELALDKLAEDLIREKGGEPGFKKVPGYTHTLCMATNDVVVHGIPTKYKFKEGDVVGVDCGVFLGGLHTDMAETVHIFAKREGKENKIDRFLRIGKEAMFEGINQVKPGNRVGCISKAIQKKVEKEGGYSVVRSLIGHGVGRELHEDPEIPGYLAGSIESTPLLKPGMTIAVEVIYNLGDPDVRYSGEDDWTIRTVDGSLGGLFERSVLVTNTGYEILT